ncbi:MAG TPA: hypothetical protein VGJ78_08460 [Vicinamibacterales bacterium]|jgi:hypothetical protein
MDLVLLTLTTLSLAAAAGFGTLSWRVGREERERARARIAALSTAMAPASPETPLLSGVAVGSVFDRTTEGLRGRTVIKLAAGAVMLLLIAGVVFLSSRTADSASAAAKAPAPLELLSMRYQRQGTTLTVSGLVKNPAGGAAVNSVTAVVFAFDRNGSFVASGRSPLDFSALAPGDESPFVVNVPNVSDVARYRVTFRSGNGVVRHIDRRTNQVQLAQAVR